MIREVSASSAVDSDEHATPREAFLRHVRIQNYKSIGNCDVGLSPLTVLVGRNGAGKSNFLDAIAFVSEGLGTSLDQAIRTRGGIEGVRRKSSGHPRNFSLELDFNLADLHTGSYGFEVAARGRGGFTVKTEQLRMLRGNGAVSATFKVVSGRVVENSTGIGPTELAEDRLYLVAASGIKEFRPAYDALTSIGRYNLNPDVIKDLQDPDAGELLRRDGSNIASVIERIERDAPQLKRRVEDYLASIVSEIEGFERKKLGPKETIEFRQRVSGATHPWRFLAANVSDGTLRALGILLSVMQYSSASTHPRMTGIEEPETALHPAAAGLLMDALREATSHTQIVLTTHSADLLDQLAPEDKNSRLLSVVNREGQTRIAPIDEASRDALRRHLYTPGELLRMDQLQPDEKDLARQAQGHLFDLDLGEDE